MKHTGLIVVQYNKHLYVVKRVISMGSINYDQREFDFYIADSKGMAIWNGDYVVIDVVHMSYQKQQGTRLRSWTL